MWLICALVAALATPSAQTPPSQEGAPVPSAYELLLARYAGGDFDAAVDQAASQRADDL